MKISFCLVLLSSLLGSLYAASVEKPAGSEATITSDELTWLHQGAETLFTGHVVLVQAPYRLTAHRMRQVQASQVVTADGNVTATYIKATGEKAVATGDHGRYNPQTHVTELWGRAKVTHWETAIDTAPVTVIADRFVLEQDKQVLEAHDNVVMTQGTFFKATADQAMLDQKEQVLHLWGPSRIQIHYEDKKGAADFKGDKGLVYLRSHRAQLLDNVKGHMTQAPL